MREATRNEDMSACGRLRLIQQTDGDIIVAVQSEENGLIQRGDSVEFCTIGAGGGRSPRTLAALRALMDAIDQDNADNPIGSDSPRSAPIAAQLDAEGLPPPVWGVVKTVGDMVRNLRTLDQSLPIHTAFHVDIEGKRRCRTRPVTISRERVIDGKWVDSMRKDVPYAVIVWAKQDERAQQPAQSIDTPEFSALMDKYDDEASYGSIKNARTSLISYIDGRTAGTAGDAVPEGWHASLTDARDGIASMLLHFTATPSSLADSIARGRGHKAIGLINRLLAAAPSPQWPAGGEGQA